LIDDSDIRWAERGLTFLILLSDGELSSGDLVLISIAFWVKVFIEESP
jgi:hypothetical protein